MRLHYPMWIGQPANSVDLALAAYNRRLGEPLERSQDLRMAASSLAHRFRNAEIQGYSLGRVTADPFLRDLLPRRSLHAASKAVRLFSYIVEFAGSSIQRVQRQLPAAGAF